MKTMKSLQQLVDSNAKEIFEKSKYKPKVMSDKNKSEIKFLVELDENRVPENYYGPQKTEV
jgi:hypothetical protein